MIETTDLAELRRYARAAMGDLQEDAERLLKLLARLEQLPEDSEAYAGLEPEIHVQATTIRVHAADVEEALEAVTDALPDDE
jgi:hypothetical protein